MNIKESIENHLEGIVKDMFKVSLEDFGKKTGRKNQQGIM